MICLGIESSCDETALALVEDGRLLDSVLATQEDAHVLFGGVVPELASREHYRCIGALCDVLVRRSGVSLHDVDVVAVSRGPGLLGSLLVGVAFAKGLACALGIPIIGVNHLHAHVLAVGLEQEIPFPALGLLVSGGHTHIYRVEGADNFMVLGRTLDDAAGEAFDKVAKVLGLPYPGGRLIDQLAARGTADPTLFPRPYTNNDSLDFSFSGLKTAVATYIAARPEMCAGVDALADPPQSLCDMCASFNRAVADTLRIKAQRALDKAHDIDIVVLAGGVAANTLIRRVMEDCMRVRGGRLLVPSPALCTDNAAMVAYAGWRLACLGYTHALDFAAVARGRPIPEDMQRISA